MPSVEHLGAAEVRSDEAEAQRDALPDEDLVNVVCIVRIRPGLVVHCIVQCAGRHRRQRRQFSLITIPELKCDDHRS